MFQLLLSQINQNSTNMNIVPLIVLLHLFSSILSICAPNPMTSLLFLILSFFSVSLLFLASGLEFLSLLILLIYVGSICVLFIFVLMILNLKILILKNYLYYKLSFIFTFVLSFLVVIIFTIKFQFSEFFIHFNDPNIIISWLSLFFNLSDLEVIGSVLFTKYIFHFLISAIILFSVMVGSVSIVSKKKKLNFKLNYLVDNEVDFLRNDFNKSVNSKILLKN